MTDTKTIEELRELIRFRKKEQNELNERLKIVDKKIETSRNLITALLKK